MMAVSTNCCSLKHIICDNNTTLNEIKEAIKPRDDKFAETTYFVILKYGEENNLEKILKELNFVEVCQFERRQVYNRSIKLKMFVFSMDDTGFDPIKNMINIPKDNLLQTKPEVVIKDDVNLTPIELFPLNYLENGLVLKDINNKEYYKKHNPDNLIYTDKEFKKLAVGVFRFSKNKIIQL